MESGQNKRRYRAHRICPAVYHIKWMKFQWPPSITFLLQHPRYCIGTHKDRTNKKVFGMMGLTLAIKRTLLLGWCYKPGQHSMILCEWYKKGGWRVSMVLYRRCGHHIVRCGWVQSAKHFMGFHFLSEDGGRRNLSCQV